MSDDGHWVGVGDGHFCGEDDDDKGDGFGDVCGGGSDDSGLILTGDGVVYGDGDSDGDGAGKTIRDDATERGAFVYKWRRKIFLYYWVQTVSRHFDLIFDEKILPVVHFSGMGCKKGYFHCWLTLKCSI